MSKRSSSREVCLAKLRRMHARCLHCPWNICTTRGRNVKPTRCAASCATTNHVGAYAAHPNVGCRIAAVLLAPTPQALAARIGINLPSSSLPPSPRARAGSHRDLASLGASMGTIGAAEASVRAELERADALLRQAMDDVLDSAQVCLLVCGCVLARAHGLLALAGRQDCVLECVCVYVCAHGYGPSAGPGAGVCARCAVAVCMSAHGLGRCTDARALCAEGIRARMGMCVPLCLAVLALMRAVRLLPI